MGVRENSSLNDAELINWIYKQWSNDVRSFKLACKRQKKCEDVDGLPEIEAQKEKLLISLAKILRQYINAVRSKRSGVQDQFKNEAHGMIEWLQKELYNSKWSSATDTILKSVQYARKHTGNLAIEGVALHKPVSASDRKRLAKLRARAKKRNDDSIVNLVAEADDGNREYSNIGLLSGQS